MKHFRPAKGWKKEVEEISLVFVVIMVFITGASFAIAAKKAPAKKSSKSSVAGLGMGAGAAVASNLIYYGKTITSEQCTTPISNGPLCTVANRVAPFSVALTDGKPPLASYMPGASLGVVPMPVPGGYVIGFGVPTGASSQLFLFWMFGP